MVRIFMVIGQHEISESLSTNSIGTEISKVHAGDAAGHPLVIEMWKKDHSSLYRGQ